LGKHSGRHAIKHRLADFGIELTDEQLLDVYNRFKEKADEMKIVPDDVLVRLASESTATQHDPYTLIDLQVLAGTQRSRIASVTIRDRDSQEERTLTGTGTGPLEAVIHCLQQAIPVSAEFEDLEIHSLSTGEDAHGEAIVSIVYNNRRYTGTAVHNDIILA